jgi:hypothetical protein
LNTTSLHQHYENLDHDHNLQMSRILCFIKTRIHHALIDVHKCISSLNSSFSIHVGRGLMMMYDIHMHLHSFNTIISDGSKYVTTTFNINTQKKYILYVCI